MPDGRPGHGRRYPPGHRTALSNFDRDPAIGHDRALAVLADFASDAPDDQKDIVLHAALHVARTCHEGDLTPPERDAALEVAKILKLDPATHGL